MAGHVSCSKEVDGMDSVSVAFLIQRIYNVYTKGGVAYAGSSKGMGQ